MFRSFFGLSEQDPGSGTTPAATVVASSSTPSTKPLSSKASSSTSSTSKPIIKKRVVNLLVITGSEEPAYWETLFKGSTIHDGDAVVKVYAAMMRDISVAAYSSGTHGPTAFCDIRQGQGATTVRVDFVLVRSQMRGASPDQDWRRVLFGLMFAGVPAVNSLHAVYSMLERPVVVRRSRMKHAYRTLDSNDD